MTRSIFDPTGGNTEHSGSRYTGPQAQNNSHMPADAVDGEVTPAEARDAEALQGRDVNDIEADVKGLEAMETTPIDDQNAADIEDPLVDGLDERNDPDDPNE